MLKRSVWIAGFMLLCSSLLIGGALAQQRPAKKQAARPPAAQAAQPVRWEMEPDGFMGMKFGELLPECPMLKPNPVFSIEYDYTRAEAEKKPCFTRANTMSLPLGMWNLPDIGTPIFDTWPELINGALEGFYFGFLNRDYENIEALFISRYGQPTTRLPVTWKNRLGLSFDSTELIWRGNNVTIRLAKHARELSKGEAHIFTAVLARDLNRKREAALDKIKGNL